MTEKLTGDTLSAAGLELDYDSIAVFFAMLAAAQARHPSGLPDKALQSVFDCHQAWLAAQKPCQQALQSGHLVGDNQNDDVSRQPHLRLVSSGRS